MEKYQSLRKSIFWASKNDVDWRADEIKRHCSEIVIDLHLQIEEVKALLAVDDLRFKLDEMKELLIRVENCVLPERKFPEKYILANTESGQMLTFADDTVIGKSLRECGSFQEEDIGKAVNILEYNNFIISKNAFLDIGANIGTHAIFALKNGFKRAICIEADPENFRVLKINQILNGLEDRCFNICSASSNFSGFAKIELSPTNFGDHRVFLEEHEKNIHDESLWRRKEIKVDRLDKLISTTNLSFSDLGFAWIDTQGHEGHVLDGAEEFLATGIPFVAEFWPYGLERSGGWPLYRRILQSTEREVFDLRRSIDAGSLCKVSAEDLDILYESWINEETRNASPHTDLLIVKKRK